MDLRASDEDYYVRRENYYHGGNVPYTQSLCQVSASDGVTRLPHGNAKGPENDRSPGKQWMSRDSFTVPICF